MMSCRSSPGIGRDASVSITNAGSRGRLEGGDFNYDYHVAFRKEDLAKGKVFYNYELRELQSEDLPGISVFYRDSAGQVYHTFSSYARGDELLIGAYNYLDLVPKGRDETGLSPPMAWVRHHDRYPD